MNDTSLLGLTETVGRRTFLKVLGSAGPAAAISACSPVPPEKIIPYVVPPEDVVPGVATWYASVCGECPSGCGTLVRTREGRSIKIEGNPSHPCNHGTLCVRGQAALQGLYNPDRFRGPQVRRTTNAAAGQRVFEAASWDEAQQPVVDRIAALRAAGRGDRIAIVTPLLSGTLDGLVDQWASAVGGARRLRYEAFAYEAIREANRLVFDRPAVPHHDFSRADLVLSFGADFLETWLSTVAHTHAHADARRVRDNQKARFVHLESRLSMTASNADEWINLEPGTEGLVATAMVHTIVSEQRVQAEGISDNNDALDRIVAVVGDNSADAVAARTGIPAARIVELARAFSDTSVGPGRTLAVGGGVAVSGTDATETQVAVALLNYVAGNVGTTVQFGTDGVWDGVSTYAEMLELRDAMRAGEIEVLILHQVNPMFTLPAAADFGSALDAVPLVVSTSSYPDETTSHADAILPTHTPLEAWGDHRAGHGTHGLMQPTMRPLFDTRHIGDLLLDTGRASAPASAPDAGAAKDDASDVSVPFPGGDFYDVLREAWRGLQPPSENDADAADAVDAAEPDPEAFENFWADALRNGGIWTDAAAETPAAPIELSGSLGDLSLAALGAGSDSGRALTLVAYPSLHFYDGRGANRPWLQEIPDPMLKATWGSWAEMTPATAASLGAEDGQLVSLESDHGSLDATVIINPHLRDGVVAIPIGQGHSDFGRYASGRGVNPMALLDPAPEATAGGVRWAGTKIDATPRDVRRPIPRLQRHFDQEGRDLAQSVSLAALAAGDVHPEEHPFSLYPDHEHPDHRWGMAIDLDACNGCNACVAACYAENNIPVMGADRMLRGRTMSWIRIERFTEHVDTAGATPGRVDTKFLPMLCQHCDHAPCESVCPVFATYHTDEGLNAQVYNRCVGTRYCANNCPYKVRRFNWFEAEFHEPLNLQLNPDVTARSAGVMEKCTFCVQRIVEGKDHARDEERPVRDGDVTPACAQTCPAQAIVFGDLNDPNSRVAQLSGSDRGYHALGVLNTRPAVTYLKKVTQSS